MRNKIIVSLMVAATMNVAAQNPFVQTWFTSDPAPMVSGDRMYV